MLSSLFHQFTLAIKSYFSLFVHQTSFRSYSLATDSTRCPLLADRLNGCLQELQRTSSSKDELPPPNNCCLHVSQENRFRRLKRYCPVPADKTNCCPLVSNTLKSCLQEPPPSCPLVQQLPPDSPDLQQSLDKTELATSSNGLPLCNCCPCTSDHCPLTANKYRTGSLSSEDGFDNGEPSGDCLSHFPSKRYINSRVKKCFNCVTGYSAGCIAICCCPLSIPVFLFFTLPAIVYRRIAGKLKCKNKEELSPYKRLGIDPTELNKPRDSLFKEDEVPFVGFGDQEHWNEYFDDS